MMVEDERTEVLYSNKTKRTTEGLTTGRNLETSHWKGFQDRTGEVVIIETK